ncbi:MAG TPA: FAD-dependent oxidoreductase, partial [Burkholderiales bacterium]|nr:FAD-dependent oxidoreductase [Burkholderiales bacterium]
MTRSRLAVLLVVAAAIAAFFLAGGHRGLSLEALKAQQATLQSWQAAAPMRSAAFFFAFYVAVTGLSLPGAALLTLGAGALFGLLWGTLLVSFAAAAGATVAFLVSRFVLRDWVQQRFGRQLAGVNRGVEREGAFYLFTLRLIPAVPFFVINAAMGLTPMRAKTFYWVSQLGMLPGTLVYVNAGRQLAAIEAPGDILSPGLLAAFVLLGSFPLAAKKLVGALRARRVYARWGRPARFERNLVVIGGGSAGLVAAYVAAAVRAKVTLVEKHRMGGDCLNTGCVPSKALIKSARVLAQIRRHRDYGIRAAQAQADFAEILARVRRVVRAVEPHDSAARYRALGVECLQGEAQIASPWEVDVRFPGGETRRLTTRSIVVAAGARPLVPPIRGIEHTGYRTSDTVWDLAALPRRLLVLGGGAVGCELAQCFARFGSRVTVVEMLPRLLSREDPEVSDSVLAGLRADGVEVLLGHKALHFVRDGGERQLVVGHAGGEARVGFDELLCALGRVANTEGYGLEALGIRITASGTIETDAHLQTSY